MVESVVTIFGSVKYSVIVYIITFKIYGLFEFDFEKNDKIAGLLYNAVDVTRPRYPLVLLNEIIASISISSISLVSISPFSLISSNILFSICNLSSVSLIDSIKVDKKLNCSVLVITPSLLINFFNSFLNLYSS
eukprot:427049_1